MEQTLAFCMSDEMDHHLLSVMGLGFFLELQAWGFVDRDSVLGGVWQLLEEVRRELRAE